MSRTDPDSTPSPAAEDPSQSDLERGSTLGRYLLLDELGQGGMGVVYKAFDPELGRPVALKVLRSDSANQSERLLREAQALARLSHPNVIAVFDVGTVAERVFIAMEFVEGPTLRQWLKQATRSRQEILDVFLAAGAGLAAAHRAGLVHRDFKPDNVLVGADGRVRVLDFGLAREVNTEPPAAPAAGDPLPRLESNAPESDTRPLTVNERPRPSFAELPTSVTPTDSGRSVRLLASQLTHAGTILGTPRFMAPEQHECEAVDARADQFSFCVTFFYALYQRFPFPGRTLEEYRDNVLRGRQIDPPSSVRVPRWLRQLLQRGLAVSPRDRFPSMDELLAVLQRSSERGRARVLAVGLGLAMSGLVVWGVLGWRARSLERAELCQGGAGRLAGTWDAATKRRVREALLGTGRPYASGVWSSVEATLDRYSARWS